MVSNILFVWLVWVSLPGCAASWLLVKISPISAEISTGSRQECGSKEKK